MVGSAAGRNRAEPLNYQKPFDRITREDEHRPTRFDLWRVGGKAEISNKSVHSALDVLYFYERSPALTTQLLFACHANSALFSLAVAYNPRQKKLDLDLLCNSRFNFMLLGHPAILRVV